MQKINLQDKSIKEFSTHYNALNLNRATVTELKTLSSEQQSISQSLRTNEETITQCVICFENKRKWACFPCGHFVYCDVCKPKESNPPCAVCRTKVIRFDNVYLV